MWFLMYNSDHSFIGILNSCLFQLDICANINASHLLRQKWSSCLEFTGRLSLPFINSQDTDGLK